MTATPAALQVVLARVRDAPARLGPAAGDLQPAGEVQGCAVQLVCIDGPAGSGKTSLAEQIGAATGAHVVHMDDLYHGWSGLLDVHVRVREQILAPMASGDVGCYQRYDWYAEQFTDWVEVPRAGLLVLEGCGAGSRVAQPYLSLLIWVDAPDEVRLRRGLERDGAALEPQWRAFMADEQILYARERTAERADLHLDAWGELTVPTAHDPSDPLMP